MDKEKLDCLKVNFPDFLQINSENKLLSKNKVGDLVEVGEISKDSNTITIHWCKSESTLTLIKEIADSCSKEIKIFKL